MKNLTLKLKLPALSLVAISFISACGASTQPDESETDAIAHSASCGATRLQAGMSKDNYVTTDFGSRLAVRSSPSNYGEIVGYLSFQNSVSVRSINTGSSEYVEIYPADGLKCTVPGCQNRALYVSHQYLEPVNYRPACSVAATRARDEILLPSASIGPQSRMTSYDQKLADFSNGRPVKATIAYADANVEPAATGMCLRYVKKAMLYGGKFFSSYPGEVAARKFGPHMERVKFENILEIPLYRDRIKQSMKNIPVGCVAVYSYININADKNAKYGHIEIRTPNGFESDYFSRNPRTGSWTQTAGRNRQLTGVFCKVK